MQMHDLTSIVQLICWFIFLAGTIVQLPQVRAIINSHLSQKRSDQLESIASIATRMAEQKLGDAPGEQKKLEAINTFKALAQGQGLSEVTEAEVNAFIEASVLFLPKSIKLFPDQTDSASGQAVPAPVPTPAPAASEPGQAPASPAAGDAEAK